MKLIVLNAGSRLKDLPNAENIHLEINSADDLRGFVGALGEQFALLWHESLTEAERILTGLATQWPVNLAGCALFSSIPYANASEPAVERLFRANPLLRGRVHICSVPVRKEGPAEAVISLFIEFSNRVSLISSSVSELPFYLLEPEAPDAAVFTALLACLISRNLRNSSPISVCLDWELLRGALSGDVQDQDFGSLKRALQHHSDPNQLKCPMCAYRGGLQHALEDPFIDPLAVLKGETYTSTLRQLTDMDPREQLTHEVAAHLLTLNSCNRVWFIKQAVDALVRILQPRCSLFCKRADLLVLRDRVEAYINGDEAGSDINAVVQEIIRALSCDTSLIEKGNDHSRVVDYKIRLAQAL